MTEFRYYEPIQVRYGDLDPQWHVNNAHILTFLEQGRFGYIVHLKLFDGKDFFNVGLIVADVHVAYLAPVQLEDELRVGVRVSRIGNKSLTFEYVLENANTHQALAKAETIMVAFDYHSHVSKRVPDNWREAITAFEGVNLTTDAKPVTRE